MVGNVDRQDDDAIRNRLESFWNFAHQLDVGGLELEEELSQILTFNPYLMAVEVNREFFDPVHSFEMRVAPVHIG